MLTTSDSIDKLSAALQLVQDAGLVVIKGRENKELGRAKYADLSDVMVKLRPVLKSTDLVIVQGPGKVRAEGNEQVMGLTTRVIHAPSGQWIESYGEFVIHFIVTSSGKVLSRNWASGTTHAYLRRYAIVAMLGIVTADEEDAQTFEREAAGQANTAPVRPRAIQASLDETWPFADFIEGHWRQFLGSDDRPYGDYTRSQIVAAIDLAIKTGERADPLKGMIFDQMDERLAVLGEQLGEALTSRGWDGSLNMGKWTLEDFRRANRLLFQDKKP